MQAGAALALSVSQQAIEHAAGIRVAAVVAARGAPIIKIPIGGTGLTIKSLMIPVCRSVLARVFGLVIKISAMLDSVGTPADSERAVWALVKLGQVIAHRLLDTGGAATPWTHTTFGGGHGLASGVKQLRRWASVPKPSDAYPNFPAFAFAVQMLPGHLVCSFVRISGRDKPRVLLLATATAAGLNLVYVQGTHDASYLDRVSGGKTGRKQ